jgi:hypothetical protein
MLVRISETIDYYSEKDGQLSSAAGELLDAEMKPDQNATQAEHQALNKHFQEVSRNIDREADERLCWKIGFTLGFRSAIGLPSDNLYRLWEQERR